MSALRLPIASWPVAGFITAFSACQSPAPPQVQALREIHTPAYDLLLPAEPKALPLLRRSGYAQAQ